MNHIDDTAFDRTIEQLQGAIATLEPLPGQQVSEPLHSSLEWLAGLPQVNLKQLKKSLASKRILRAVVATSKHGKQRRKTA